jgi:hypothetical protein
VRFELKDIVRDKVIRTRDFRKDVPAYSFDPDRLAPAGAASANDLRGGFEISKLKLQILIIASLCFVTASARSASAQGRVKVRAKGHGSIVVTERGRARTLDISKQIDAAHIEDADVLFITRKGGFVYLLLEVCGLSRFPPGDRQCGAGIECNLVWLKLDERWRALDAKSERYESCWAPITSEEGPKVKGRLLTLEFDDLRENLRHEVTYDADAPERGLKSATRPLPEP